MGVNTISAGATIACGMELYERGIISIKEVERSLNLGDADAMVEMVKLMGYREGFGYALAEGSYRFAEKFRHPEYSMSVRSWNSLPMTGEGRREWAFNMQHQNRGACHIRGYMISPEIFGLPQKLDPFEIKDKVGWDKGFQDFAAVVNSVSICLMDTNALGGPEIPEYLQAATGIDMTVDELMKAGGRIWNLKRLFNLKAGLTAKDDCLPDRIVKEPLPSGPAKRQVVKLDKMLPENYELRGWDKEGIPTKEKLNELEL